MPDTSPAPGQTSSQPASPAPAAAAAAAPAAPAAAAPAASAPASAAPAPALAAPAAAAAPAPSEPAKPAADAAAAPAAPAAPVIPDTYVFAAPETDAFKGFKFNDALAPAMSPVLKKAGLTQDQATTVVHGFLEYQMAARTAQLDADLKVTMADEKLGKLNYAKTQANVNRALAGFTDPEFRQLLEQTGLANRLEFVRVFERIGRAMAGDTTATSQPTSAAEESMADRMYSRARKVS